MNGEETCVEDLERLSKDEAELYASHLEFLWEQYNNLLSLGFLMGTATLAFLMRGILFSKDFHEITQQKQIYLNKTLLGVSIILAGCASALFVLCRWCSQVLMERQVYGNYQSAMSYFQRTLDDETILPSALRPKFYMRKLVSRQKLLSILGFTNELCKWIAISCLFASWILTVIFSWPMIR